MTILLRECRNLFVRIPRRGMAKDKLSGSFDFTSSGKPGLGAAQDDRIWVVWFGGKIIAV